MNKETYEALKRIQNQAVFELTERRNEAFDVKDIEQVEAWVDEVAKEYTD